MSLVFLFLFCLIYEEQKGLVTTKLKNLMVYNHSAYESFQPEDENLSLVCSKYLSIFSKVRLHVTWQCWLETCQDHIPAVADSQPTGRSATDHSQTSRGQPLPPGHS